VVAQFPGNNAARAQENLSRMKPTKIGQAPGERQLLGTKQVAETRLVAADEERLILVRRGGQVGRFSPVVVICSRKLLATNTGV
jgi:hypothetical protein